MELLLYLVTKQDFKKGWKSSHLLHCLSTVTSFNWLLCKLLMLHQVSRSMSTLLMTLWKFFHHSPKHAESSKEIQKVLDLTELKIAKPSDTRWLAHKRCVKAVKASYSSIVLALENIYESSHEPEALGLSKALSSHSTIAAMYLLDYILPQVAKLSRALQTKHLYRISSLVDATLYWSHSFRYMLFSRKSGQAFYQAHQR